MANDARGYPHGGRVRPGQQLELGPPPVDQDGDVEAEDEGDGDEVGELVAVDGHLLELHPAIVSQTKSVPEGSNKWAQGPVNLLLAY